MEYRWERKGMRYSLVSREVIADSIETVVGGQGFDGLITIGGCDKNMPACVMAMARLNRPSIFVYGGSIRPGANRTDVVSVFEAVGKHSEGSLSDRTFTYRIVFNPRSRLMRRYVYS